MTNVFRRSFTRDLRKIRNRRVLTNVEQAIENVEAAETVADVANLKELAHTKNCTTSRLLGIEFTLRTRGRPKQGVLIKVPAHFP
jgi:hypothetical protein